ncbi:MAG: cytochrome c biogenesis protein [Ignavibacteria bacterium]|nr:cytochrome c biogenesis protein [Ignavibacteria bacterium]
MKGLILGLSVLIGIVLGLYPSIDKPKPLWWKLVVIITLFLTIFLTFAPHIGSNFATFRYIAQNVENFSGPLYFQIAENSKVNVGTDENPIYKMEIFNPKLPVVKDTLIVFGNIPYEINSKTPLIAEVRYDSTEDNFIFVKLVSINPLFVLPLVPQLGEQIRIMNFHVPCAWVAVVAYLFSLFYSVKYLKHRNFEYDQKAYSSIYLGTIFAFLATVTGMIWAKFNWGSFWNWDPRQTTMFVLLLIYLAYFVLRQSLNNPDIRARLSSSYSIVAFLTVPFLVFVLPRLLESNHPGSINSPNIGPIISTQEETLNPLQTLGFGFGFTSFTLIFFWLLNIKVRFHRIENLFKRSL